MEIGIKRSNRKTMALEITKDAKVLVRAPFSISMEEIKRFVNEQMDWIEKTQKKVEEARSQRQEIPQMTNKELHALADRALEILPKKTAAYAEKMGVTYGRITIRNQKTKWGSCSGKGNLNFNCLLMLAPEEVQDYIVVHELCHRLEMNHSKAFWEEVEAVLPDYRQQKKWLKVHGSELMARMGV